MALVTLGSRRVTRDFDFVVPAPGDRLGAPSSAYFFNSTTGLRVDLLFDFPVPAAQLAARATRIKVRSQTLLVAGEGDLLNLKRIAHEQRVSPGDTEDIAFLEARRRSN